MSVLLELNGKAGRVCAQAQAGEIRCPLIVRSSSEDVLSGETFGHLRHIRPHLWLAPLIQVGLGAKTHSRVWYRNLSIRLWERQNRFPPELLKFREGNTEPDIIIEWENPPTTVWLEAKYTSGLAQGTTHSDQNDQVVRGIRTLLAATGHIQTKRLFQIPRRIPVWMALLNARPDPLVERYRDPRKLARSLRGIITPKHLPADPFIGTVTWNDIAEILEAHQAQMTAAERSVSKAISEYLRFKSSMVGELRTRRAVQSRLLIPTA